MLGVINRQASAARSAPLFSAAQRRAAAAVAFVLVAGLPGFTTQAAYAADVLTVVGASLDPSFVKTSITVDVRRVVTLNGDQPIATYMTARNVSGTQLVRTRQGYWLPWTGRAEDLADAGLTAQSGTLEYKLLKEDLSGAQLPITVSIGYRTAQGIKFGTFEIRAQ